jgi:hypothetical protein
MLCFRSTQIVDFNLKINAHNEENGKLAEQESQRVSG